MKFPPLHRAVSVLAGILLAMPVLRAQTPAPGSIDAAFNPRAGGDATATVLALRRDGRILAGGDLTRLNDEPRNGLGLLNANGFLEYAATFHPASGGEPFAVRCLALQRDGKTVSGGHFMVARHLPGGALDPAFNPALTQTGVVPGNFVSCLSIQQDGRILVGGRFTAIGGVARNGIARLLPDGGVDLTFDPGSGVGGPSAMVRSLALQDDGKILIAGNFTSVNGQPRSQLARLDPNGNLESTATFSVTFGAGGSPAELFAVVVQPDGRIAVGGQFTTVNGSTRFNVARLLANGSFDAPPPVAGLSGMVEPVQSLALQADGKLVMAGPFYVEVGEHRHLGRLLADQRLDTSFVIDEPVFQPELYNIALQADGKVVFAGGRIDHHGVFNARIYRFNNDPAVQSLDIPAKNRIVWMRGGSAPEAGQVTFETSRDGGATWQDRGPGTRIPGGWQWTGATLPSRVTVRARGATRCGFQSGSSGLVESIASFDRGPGAPDIIVEQPAGTVLTNGEPVDFGAITFGDLTARTFTIRNDGDADLSGFHFTVDGPDAAMFFVSAPSPAVVEPGETATFTVHFGASATGPRTAALHLASNDPDNGSLTFTLTGSAAGSKATEIAVEQPAGVNFPDGGAMPFGSVVTDSFSSRTWVIKNEGPENLTGLSVVITGPDAAQFSVTAAPSALVSPGGNTNLTVNFSPSSAGIKSAVLHLLCNDTDESPFDIVLTGRGLAPPPMGAPDLTFGGTGGVVATGIGVVSAAFGMALQSDGKIVTAGYYVTAGTWPRFAVWRFHPDGRPDTGFNGTGLVLIGFTGWSDEIAACVQMQSDGKIVVGGQSKGRFALARLLPDGSFDPAFNGGGQVTTVLGPNLTGGVKCLAIQSDGRIVAGGDASPPGARHGALARYLPDGSLDPSFGGGGIIVAHVNNVFTCEAVTVQSHGRIVAAGTSGDYPVNVFTLVGFTAAGAPDTSFGSSGATFTPIAIRSHVRGMAVQPDGKLVLTGYAEMDVLSTGRLALARYLPNGTLDSSFGQGGYSLGPTGDSVTSGYAVAFQADGKILVAGASLWSIGSVLRFHPDGSTDPSFLAGPAAFALENAGGGVLAVQSDGNILLCGHYRYGGVGLARFIGSPVPRPEILLTAPDGAWIPHSGLIDFGGMPPASVKSLILTIRNPGSDVLTTPSFTVEGAEAAQFDVPSPPAEMEPGSFAPLIVTFTPAGLGSKNAVLRITSNDAGTGTFLINLTGLGREPIAGDHWRMTHFGTFDNSGPSADLSDPDGDNLVNLVEFFTGSDPRAATPAVGQLMKNGNSAVWTFPRRIAALAELDAITEFNNTLTGPWDPAGSAAETIISDDGVFQNVRITIGMFGSQFARLRITRK